VLHRIWSSSSAGESHPHALTESGRPPARSRLPKPCRSAPRRTARARCPRTRLSREACRAGLSPRPSRVARLLTARHVTSGCRFRAALRRRPAGASVRPRRLRSARWRRWGTATWRGLPPSAPVSACRRLRHAVPLVSAVGGRGSARTGACRRRLAQPPNGATRGGCPSPRATPAGTHVSTPIGVGLVARYGRVSCVPVRLCWWARVWSLEVAMVHGRRERWPTLGARASE
jgi:hypothetical protein